MKCKEYIYNNASINDYSELNSGISWWKIFLNEWVSIWKYNIIQSWTNKTIKIWKNTIFWPLCIMIWANHKYDNINIPIKKQWGISKDIIIKENAWCASSVIILWWSIIWKNSVIWANSLVLKELEDYWVYVGSPCKKIKNIS